MPCIPFRGGYVCTRGRRDPICKCGSGKPADRLCDWPLTGRKAGATCNRRCCDACALRVSDEGEGIDYCPPHARMHAGEKACETCGEIVPDAAALRLHEAEAHTEQLRLRLGYGENVDPKSAAEALELVDEAL